MRTPLPLMGLGIVMAWRLTAGCSGVAAQTLASVYRPIPLRPPTAAGTPPPISLRQLLTQLETSYGVRFNDEAALVREVTVAAPPVADFSDRLTEQLNRLLAPTSRQCRAMGARTFVVQPRAGANPPLGGRQETQLVDDYYLTDGKSIATSPLYNPRKPYDNRNPRFYQTIVYPGSRYLGAVVRDNQYVQTGYTQKKYTIYPDDVVPTALKIENQSDWI